MTRIDTNETRVAYGKAGECQVTPTAILVHDPVAAGAMDVFQGRGNQPDAAHELLFREGPDIEHYATQHRALVDELRSQVAHVWYLSELVGDLPGFTATATNPNHVFTRDALITLPWVPDGYICSNMKRTLRRDEWRLLATAVERLGLTEIVRLPDDVILEGGDVIPFVWGGRRILFVGVGRRSNFRALEFLRSALMPGIADEIIGIELADWRMNLDGGFVPVAVDVLVCDTDSILGAWRMDQRGPARLDLWKMLDEMGIRVIDTPREESVYAQSCNCLCVGERRIVYYDLCPRVAEQLRQHDIDVRLVPGSELVKGRGGPRCLTRPIYLPVDEMLISDGLVR